MDDINLNIQEVGQEAGQLALDTQATQEPIEGAVIVAIGVGGGGSNTISHLSRTNPHQSVKLIAANTDIQALKTTSAGIKIKLGEKLTAGLGAGAKPDVGERAALETYEEIKSVLHSANIVFICAGLGGGTGTGAAPVIAKAAKEQGVLTVSIVTKPFKWEGAKKARFAEEGLKKLKAESDCIIVIPNDRLAAVVGKKCGIKESFKMVDDVLTHAVNGISSVILGHGENDINVDFADVRTIMSHNGLALMGIGEASGENAASQAIRAAIESPLLDNISVKGAMGVLINFEMHGGYPMDEISEAMQIVESMADNEADVVFGTHTYADMPQDFVRATIFVTGFEKALVGSDSPDSSASHFKLVQESMKKVSSGEDYSIKDMGDDNYLEVPTYMRRQMD